MGGQASEWRVRGRTDLNRVFARAMPVSRGLFALRYLAADDERNPPRVSVHVAPDLSDEVKLLFAPGAEDGVLRASGDAVVVCSSGDAVIVVTIFVGELAQADGVKLKLDRLDRVTSREDELVRGASPLRGAGAEQEDVLPIHLSGHLERRGDVSQSRGEWLGGRSSRQRIEGFAVHWPRRPLGVDIEYRCAVSGMGELPETLTGDFVGTRGRAKPINAVFLRLVGESAPHYRLEAEAAFGDGTVVRSDHSELAALPRDPTAPLVGLVVKVRRSGGESVSRPERGKGLGPRSERVRVYRGARNVIHRQAAE